MNKIRYITLCKFQSGTGGARSAGSRSIFPGLRTGNRTQPAPKTCTEPLAKILNDKINI